MLAPDSFEKKHPTFYPTFYSVRDNPRGEGFG
jgi:hypothetical protein